LREASVKTQKEVISNESETVYHRSRRLPYVSGHVRDTYRNEKTLPDGWTKEDWKAFLVTKKELLAAVKNTSVEVSDKNSTALSETAEEASAETETEAEGPTVKDLVAERRFDEALALLTSKKEARLEKLAERKNMLAVWQQIDAMLMTKSK